MSLSIVCIVRVCMRVPECMPVLGSACEHMCVCYTNSELSPSSMCVCVLSPSSVCVCVCVCVALLLLTIHGNVTQSLFVSLFV